MVALLGAMESVVCLDTDMGRGGEGERGRGREREALIKSESVNNKNVFHFCLNNRCHHFQHVSLRVSTQKPVVLKWYAHTL